MDQSPPKLPSHPSRTVRVSAADSMRVPVTVPRHAPARDGVPGPGPGPGPGPVTPSSLRSQSMQRLISLRWAARIGVAPATMGSSVQTQGAEPAPVAARGAWPAAGPAASTAAATAANRSPRIATAPAATKNTARRPTTAGVGVGDRVAVHMGPERDAWYVAPACGVLIQNRGLPPVRGWLRVTRDRAYQVPNLAAVGSRPRAVEPRTLTLLP